MKARKTFVSAAVAAALLMNIPQVSAENVETFGENFDENNSEVIPFQEENDDLGPVLVFNDPEKNSTENLPAKEPPTDTEKPVITEKPAVNETPAINETPKVTKTPKVKKVEAEEVVIEPDTKNSAREKVMPQSKNTKKGKNMKSQRFIMVAADDTYIYYLDKQSISWKRMPYSASEYILDFWVRMIERTPDTSDLPQYLSDYVSDGVNGEIEVAASRGVTFNSSDVEILNHKKYFLEHYYIRPKTNQIQFLCELEVVGHPQNTVSEREYNYKNWENLIPGSIESMIYQTTMKSVHKSKGSEKGHMSVADMFDEYLRISIR